MDYRQFARTVREALSEYVSPGQIREIHTTDVREVYMKLKGNPEEELRREAETLAYGISLGMKKRTDHVVRRMNETLERKVA